MLFHQHNVTNIKSSINIFLKMKNARNSTVHKTNKLSTGSFSRLLWVFILTIPPDCVLETFLYVEIMIFVFHIFSHKNVENINVSTYNKLVLRVMPNISLYTCLKMYRKTIDFCVRSTEISNINRLKKLLVRTKNIHIP